MPDATPPRGFVRNLAPSISKSTWPASPSAARCRPGLAGTLLRIGPNPLFLVPGEHWFAGDGMVHAFHTASGQMLFFGYGSPKWLGAGMSYGVLGVEGRARTARPCRMPAAPGWRAGASISGTRQGGCARCG